MEPIMDDVSNYILRYCLYLLVCCSLLAGQSGTVLARPVSLETAQQVAVNWIKQRTGVQKNISSAVPGKQKMTKQSLSPALYTINMDGGGWVLVSGDDVAYPVIGYALKGSASPEHIPPAFQEWITEVQKTIRNAAQKALNTLPENRISVKNRTVWDTLKMPLHQVNSVQATGVSPLLKTTWSQGKYYNTLCPYDSSAPDWADHRTFVGCVATAMGQVMKYHNWPDQGVGTHSYSHPKYGTLSANFGATRYNWGAMPWGSVTEYNTAVATLLYHAGVSLEMHYGPDGSGAYTGWVAVALKTYFKYKDTVTYEHRASFSTGVWENKLRTELDAHRPLVYRGNGTGGHAFVCDGYSGTNYFHFNWGWDGWYDGYFYLSDLTPGDYSFNSYQGAVLGIEPDGKPEQTKMLNLTSILSLLLGK